MSKWNFFNHIGEKNYYVIEKSGIVKLKLSILHWIKDSGST
jgi:hypothetical protein